MAGAVFAGTLLSGALLFPAPAGAIPDSDSDGLTDTQEVDVYKTNPNVKDTDGDVLSDGLEVSEGTNPLNPDTDGDELADGEEHRLGLNMLNPDTDGDTYTDGFEVDVSNTDPKKANPKPQAPAAPAPAPEAPAPEPEAPAERADSDGDGLFDDDEKNVYGTNPNRADTDFDGRDDGQEVFEETNPRVPFL